jgi:hypothetical protein
MTISQPVMIVKHYTQEGKLEYHALYNCKELPVIGESEMVIFYESMSMETFEVLREQTQLQRRGKITISELERTLTDHKV